MNFPEIEIHILSRTVPDCSALQEWARSFPKCEEHKLPAAATGAELLISYAAKRCYRSFEPKSNPNVSVVRKDLTKFFDNILASGHGCYDSETEVLTAGGWKFWPDVTKDDCFATRSLTGVLSYERPIALNINQPYIGRMYRVESRGADLFVTPNHRMFVCKTTTVKGRKREDESYEFIEAKKLGHCSHAYVKTALWTRQSSAPSYSLALASLLGFAIGDGYLNGSSIVFHLRCERKISWLIDLAQRLPELKFIYSPETGYYRFELSKPYQQLFSQIYDDNLEKRIPSGFLLQQSAEVLRSLFAGLMQAEGFQTDPGWSFDTTSKTLADQFQILCLHIGLSANFGYELSGEQCGSFGDKLLRRVFVIRRSLRPEINKFDGHKGKSSWVDDWEGLVHCAQVPNGTLYVRRNGVPVWCGNSVLEHATFTFAFENVTRVFTAELNRHRAGCAISEQSLRYVRFDDIPFWVPLSIRSSADNRYLEGPEDADPDDLSEFDKKKLLTRRIMRNVISEVESSYKKLVDIWELDSDDSKFGYKKRITSMLRRLIPMGVCTGGVWTFNVRALRHIVAMRTSVAAEEEIAAVFGTVAEILIAREPRLFGDFVRNDNGSFVPKHPKV